MTTLGRQAVLRSLRFSYHAQKQIERGGIEVKDVGCAILQGDVYECALDEECLEFVWNSVRVVVARKVKGFVLVGF